MTLCFSFSAAKGAAAGRNILASVSCTRRAKSAANTRSEFDGRVMPLDVGREERWGRGHKKSPL